MDENIIAKRVSFLCETQSVVGESGRCHIVGTVQGGLLCASFMTRSLLSRLSFCARNDFCGWGGGDDTELWL